MTRDEFESWQLILSRVDSVERRVEGMDVELTQVVARATEAHHAASSLSSEVARMTDSFRAFRSALYAAAATIVAAAVLVILLGQHP